MPPLYLNFKVTVLVSPGIRENDVSSLQAVLTVFVILNSVRLPGIGTTQLKFVEGSGTNSTNALSVVLTNARIFRFVVVLSFTRVMVSVTGTLRPFYNSKQGLDYLPLQKIRYWQW
jgi:hypothetical protein